MILFLTQEFFLSKTNLNNEKRYLTVISNLKPLTAVKENNTTSHLTTHAIKRSEASFIKLISRHKGWKSNIEAAVHKPLGTEGGGEGRGETGY
jgi:hypothetical protein